jgi:hypothetical protein
MIERSKNKFYKMYGEDWRMYRGRDGFLYFQ